MCHTPSLTDINWREMISISSSSQHTHSSWYDWFVQPRRGFSLSHMWKWIPKIWMLEIWMMSKMDVTKLDAGNIDAENMDVGNKDDAWNLDAKNDVGNGC